MGNVLNINMQFGWYFFKNSALKIIIGLISSTLTTNYLVGDDDVEPRFQIFHSDREQAGFTGLYVNKVGYIMHV